MNNDIKKILKPGDVVFISITNFLYRRVANATNSWTSHVGMVHSLQDGQWMIAESAVPYSKMCPLDEFIKRSDGGRIAVRRLKDELTEEDILKLQNAADARMDRLYHLGFKFDSNRQFCSKFVYEIFKEVKDLEIGSLEPFRELLNRNPDTPQTFWRIWFFGFIPWNRRTVTPASQYESTKLTTVYKNI